MFIQQQISTTIHRSILGQSTNAKWQGLKMKIICAGLQKTGTKTMAQALRILGYNVHDVFEQFFYEKELWDKVLENSASVEDYQKFLGEIDAVMDWPAVAVWEQIMGAFPDAKIILTVRSTEDEWYESMKKHFEVANQYVTMNETLLRILLLFAGPLAREFNKTQRAFIPACLGLPVMYGSHTETFLRSRYRQHNLYVKSICPNEKLLIYNVKDGWKPLCDFLNVGYPDTPFPRENIKSDMIHKLLNNKWEHDCGFQSRMDRQIRINSQNDLIIWHLVWLPVHVQMHELTAGGNLTNQRLR
ncbi:uncharacterized protein LOC120332494 isoform X1 [Styela clava]